MPKFHWIEIEKVINHQVETCIFMVLVNKSRAIFY